MKLITRRDRIQDVPDRWKAQYAPAWGPVCDGSSLGIHRKLRALERDTCDRAAVDDLIGNKSWTEITCDECKQDVEAAVELGEEPDYESSIAVICLECLAAALNLVGASPARRERPDDSASR